ncbi:MAG TPA: hypothetical protein VGH49_09970 [Xanthobacteraceae bacterium]
MTTATLDAGGNFRIGNVLGRAMEICVANFPFFFVVTFIVALPNLLLLREQTQPPTFQWSMLFAILLAIVLNTIGQAVILRGAFQQLRGRPLNVGEAVQKGLARFFPILGLALLYGLGLGVAFLLLVVPFFIVGTMWAVALPACVVEELGPTASLGRSRSLTKGYRWKIFWIMLLLLIVSAIVGGVIRLVLAPMGFMVAAFGSIIWTAIWAAYWNCVLIMIYHDLRVAKEGVDTAEIAAVFD